MIILFGVEWQAILTPITLSENHLMRLLIALSPVWERVDKHELDAFLSKWDTIFRDNDYHQLGPVNEEEYVSELENLLKNAVVTR